MQSSQSSAERPYEEFIPGRVYYVALRADPRQTAKSHCFSGYENLFIGTFSWILDHLILGNYFGSAEIELKAMIDALQIKRSITTAVLMAIEEPIVSP